MEIEIKKSQPRNRPEDRTPNIGDGVQTEYQTQNFKDRQGSMLRTELKSRLTPTSQPEVDQLDSLLQAHAIATQGGLKTNPKKEAAFWKLVEIIRMAKQTMRPDNPYITTLINLVRTQYFSRYNSSLTKGDTMPGPIVATAPVGFAPMPYQMQPQVSGFPDAMTQPLPPPPPQRQDQQPQEVPRQE